MWKKTHKKKTLIGIAMAVTGAFFLLNTSYILEVMDLTIYGNCGHVGFLAPSMTYDRYDASKMFSPEPCQRSYTVSMMFLLVFFYTVIAGLLVLVSGLNKPVLFFSNK